METPSSTTRVTRSQALINNSNNNIPISRKVEESEKILSKSRQMNNTNPKQQQQDRSALIDITNDSPIVGLAMGSLETPLSSFAKQRSFRIKNDAASTPGSGEDLLRGQVKNLLQKVEEEAVLSKLSSMETHRPFLHLHGLINSPAGILAPTPANTPQITNLSGESPSITPSPMIEEQLISQLVSDIFEGKKKQEESNVESESIPITRSLLLDFSEKSETSDSSDCSSVLTYQEEKQALKSNPDEDDASVWSIQVNATSSIHDGEEEEEEEVIEGEEEEDYEIYDDEEGEEGREFYVDDLCEGISRISMTNNNKAVKFEGKHTRFVYNSDDELVEGRTSFTKCD